MKTLLKVIAGFVGLLVAAGLVAYLVYNEPRPAGETGVAAEALADRMLGAVNKAAWDTTNYVAFTFRGEHSYAWRRDVDSVRVSWDDKVVDLHTKSVTGAATVNGEPVTGATADELVQQAWGYFCNDSFWLAAPFKVRDPGTERSIVTLENGEPGLLISYTSGGVTPGDAYLWELDATGLPIAYQMWTSIIPVGGVRATWEGYTSLASGAKLATRHGIGPTELIVSVEE